MSVIFFKPRGTWRVQWMEAGKRQSRYFRTESEARSFESERLAAKADNEQMLTLGELVILYFRANETHPKTKKNLVYFLAGHEKNGKHIEGLGEFLRDKYAEQLTRQDLEAMREAFRAKGTSPNTINKHQAYIRAVLAWGVDQELIRLNPWRDYKRLPAKRFLFKTSFEDFQRVLRECPEWLVWAIKTAYALALRPGIVELFSLPWTSFHWRYGYVLVVQGKTGNVKKVVPPVQYWKEARRRYEEDMANGIPWVCHRAGKRVLAYHEAWQQAVKRAGLQGQGVRMYDIRHIAASEMLARQADLVAVAAQLGHSTTQTTASNYSHVVPNAQQRAAELLPPLFD